METNSILLGDSLDVLPSLPSAFASMIYIDPPFNTGKTRKSTEEFIRIGGIEYRYEDSFKGFEEFLIPRIEAGLRCLSNTGSIFVHLDYREVHYTKVALDKLLGRNRFINEIIWAYDYGGRPKNKWPTKHDTILWYAMNPEEYTFNFSEMDRIPYMAPGLVGEEKAKLGKTPTDVWWHTIVPTNGKEKTGYPTQKPLGVLNRLIKIHSTVGNTVLDFFAGSGTTGEAAASNNRNFVLVDKNPDAFDLMAKRLAIFEPQLIREPPNDK